MGECNPYAMDLISKVTGHTPIYSETNNGQQSLIIGEIVIVAKNTGLWGDPSAYQRSDQILEVSWGGQSATLVKDDDGSWAGQIVADALQGKANFLD